MVKLWPELTPNVRSRLSLTARKMASGGMCRRSPLVLSLAGFRIAIELPQTKGHLLDMMGIMLGGLLLLAAVTGGLAAQVTDRSGMAWAFIDSPAAWLDVPYSGTIR